MWKGFGSRGGYRGHFCAKSPQVATLDKGPAAGQS